MDKRLRGKIALITGGDHRDRAGDGETVRGRPLLARIGIPSRHNDLRELENFEAKCPAAERFNVRDLYQSLGVHPD